MVDPVVSSRFGKRPLLDIPAMAVTGHGHLEVPSIQQAGADPLSTKPFSQAHNPMLGAGTYNPQLGLAAPQHHAPASQGLPAVQAPNGYDRRYNTAPQLGFQPQQSSHYYGPNGELVQPAPFYSPQDMFPGILNPFGQQAPLYQAPPAPPPQPQPVYLPPPRVMPQPFYGPSGFNVICGLEYGRVVNINLRDSKGEFRGIPPFLKDELLRTYSKYKYTEVKIRMENGEFHIFANHSHRGRSGRSNRRSPMEVEDSDTYYEHHDERFRQDTHRHNYHRHHHRPDDTDSDGIRPRGPNSRPRGINHEEGWDAYR